MSLRQPDHMYQPANCYTLLCYAVASLKGSVSLDITLLGGALSKVMRGQDLSLSPHPTWSGANCTLADIQSSKPPTAQSQNGSACS